MAIIYRVAIFVKICVTFRLAVVFVGGVQLVVVVLSPMSRRARSPFIPFKFVPSGVVNELSVAGSCGIGMRNLPIPLLKEFVWVHRQRPSFTEPLFVDAATTPTACATSGARRC